MSTLVIVKGPNEGQRYELGVEATIGRNTFCDVVINSTNVSRQHARIRKHDDGFYVEDLNSLNGTFVNGQQVDRAVLLRHKDRINIYETLLAFLDSANSDANLDGIDEAKELLTTQTRPLGPNIVSSVDTTSDSRIIRNAQEKWRASLTMMRSLGKSLDVDEILRRILDDLFNIFPQGDRGHILLIEPNGSLSIRAMKVDGGTNSEQTLAPVDQDLARRVVANREAILCVDQDDEDSVSVLDAPVRSMICAPLMSPLGKPLGVIYIDTKDEQDRFQEEDVELLASVSNVAGQAVEFARLHQVSMQRQNTAKRAMEKEISERKLVEQNLRRSNAELEQFAYVASHDLQEPLRAIGGYVQLLQQQYQNSLDEKAEEYIHHVVDGAKRMQSLIDDLLLFSRVGRQGKPFAATECNQVFDTVVANLKTAIDESGGTVVNHGLPKVMADASQLVQLFHNLIGNAIKFRGPQPAHVEVDAEKRNGEWLFSVRDNGIGFKPEHCERVFIVFQRLHTRSKFPGTGIGLAICKKIVERHQGRIWVESELGQGSVFYFTLPAEGAN